MKYKKSGYNRLLVSDIYELPIDFINENAQEKDTDYLSIIE
jgi:hypothetical protein